MESHALSFSRSTFVCLSVAPHIHWLICHPYAWETRGVKTTHESNIDLIGHSLVFTHAGILAEPVNIRNSPGIDIFDPDFPIEHRPFCSHVGSAIQNWSSIQYHMQQQSEENNCGSKNHLQTQGYLPLTCIYEGKTRS